MTGAVFSMPLKVFSEEGNNKETEIFRQPIIHTTDLIHPPWDCDDQVDLACLYALSAEYDIKSIIIDNHIDFTEMKMYEPAFNLIVQLNWMTGKSIPFAAGSAIPMINSQDDGSSLSIRDQAGINLIIDSLKSSNRKVLISIIGSSRTVARAFNREPNLFREKVKGILLVAGSPVREKDSDLDTNTKFDIIAFKQILESGLPIFWSPPNSGIKKNKTSKEKIIGNAACAIFQVPHDILFQGLPKLTHNWLMFGFLGNQRGDIIRALHEDYYACSWWGVVKPGVRTLSSIIAIAYGAGREVIKKENNQWGFISKPGNSTSGSEKEYPIKTKRIKLNVFETGHTEWVENNEGNIWLLHHKPDLQEYSNIMGEAVNNLIKELPIGEDVIIKS